MSRTKHLAMAAGLAITLFAASSAQEARASCSATAYYGQICYMAGDFCPRDYTRAEGQLLAISANPELYSLLGTNFGGDGENTFALPDLRGRVAVGTGQAIGSSTDVTVGMQRGTQFTHLTKAQMPAHKHDVDLTALSVVGTLKVNGSTANQPTPAGHYPGPTPVAAFKPYSTQSSDGQMKANAVGGSVTGQGKTGSTGGAAAISLQGPRLGLTPCIRTDNALYPPRN